MKVKNKVYISLKRTQTGVDKILIEILYKK